MMMSRFRRTPGMSERQRQATWAELQRQRATVEAHKSIATLEAALADVEQQLGPAMAEEARRRQAYEAAGWAMVVALDRRDPGASLLAEREDPERVELDRAEVQLAEMTRVVNDLADRRARIRQALTRVRVTVLV